MPAPDWKDTFRAHEAALYASYDLRPRVRDVRLATPSIQTRAAVCGEGPPVVLLHPAGGFGAMWAPLMAAWRDVTHYAVDLPGCGVADPFDYTGVDVRAHGSAFVASVLDALQLDRAVVVGASLGGMFALNFAQQQPARATALVVLGAPAVALDGAVPTLPMAAVTRRPIAAVMRWMPAPGAGMTKRALRMIIGRNAVDRVPDEMFLTAAAGGKQALVTQSRLYGELMKGRKILPGRAFTDDELRGIDVPTLWIWGESDVFAPPAVGRRAADLMSRALLEVMPGGHHPWWDDAASCGAWSSSFVAAHA